MTKLLGVIGDPIAHSLSPLIHNYWIRQKGLPATYEALRVTKEDFGEALGTLAQRNAVGFNVTMPHKLAAHDACTSLSPAAKAIGAVNTLTLREDKMWDGHNTDADGFLAALKMQNIEVTPQTKTIVIGAGGAARAVVYALSSIDILPLILNRTQGHARQLSLDLTGGESVYGPIESLYGFSLNADLIINTVSLAHEGKVLNLPAGNQRPFIDISYGPPATQQLALASHEGWITHDGLPMLVSQAAFSFERWFGVNPPTEEVLIRCRELVSVTS